MSENILFKPLILFAIVVLILIHNGCIPYHKLSKTEFPQGQDLDLKSYAIAQLYLKSSAVYNQFTTLAIFDALWLSDDVRNAYVCQNCLSSGKNEESKQAFLNRQLEENKHEISFYVLADIRQHFGRGLNEKNSYWKPFISVDGQKIEPVLIKEVELDPEYKTFFDPRFSSLKTAYLVQFPATDASGKHYLKDCKKLELTISSVEKACCLEWDLSKLEQAVEKVQASKKRVKKNGDYYWG
jgi:hypothetical protein